MPKKLFKKISPSADYVRNHKSLGSISHWLQDANLFHLNRQSVSRAFAVGLGVAMTPIYGHIIIAATLAIWSRANLAISLLLVWVSNPITFPFMLVAEYWVGTRLLGIDSNLPTGNLALSDWQIWITEIWKPLLFGSLVVSLLVAVSSYFFIQIFWRWVVVRKWQKRINNNKF